MALIARKDAFSVSVWKCLEAYCYRRLSRVAGGNSGKLLAYSKHVEYRQLSAPVMLDVTLVVNADRCNVKTINKLLNL